MNLSPAYLKQRQEWFEQGEIQGKLKTIPRLQERGFSIEEIAEVLGLEVEQVRAYLRDA
jgi:predicted transposase/invertase (TIGR01784 family)